MGSNVRRKIMQYLKENGLRRTLIWITAKSLKSILQGVYQGVNYELWSISLDRIPDYEETPKEDYHCRHLQREDLWAIEKQFENRILEDFARRMETSTGYLVFDRDKIAGYGWTSNNLIKGEGVAPFLLDIYPKKGNMYFYDDFVIPEKRGKGLNTKLFHYKLSECRKQGFIKEFGLVEKHNLPMKKIHEKFGGKIEGRICFQKYVWRVAKKTSALAKVCDLP